MKHKTRESWIRKVALIINKEILKPSLIKAMPLKKVNGEAMVGMEIKKIAINKIQFACAYMPNMRVSQSVRDNQLYGKARAIGQCHYGYESDAEGLDKENFLTNIFISPTLSDPVQVAEVILHELIHTMTKGHNHEGAFRWIAEYVAGLAFTPKGKGHTYALPELKTKLEKITKRVGKYPHKKWMPNKSYKKQTTRMFKLVSLGVMIQPEDGKGNNGYEPKPYIVRASRTVLGAGFPLDPDGGKMYLEVNQEQVEEIIGRDIPSSWKNGFKDLTINLPSGGRGMSEKDYMDGRKGLI